MIRAYVVATAAALALFGQPAQAGSVPLFSYVELGRTSPYASEQSPRARQQQLSDRWLGVRTEQDGKLYREALSAAEMIGTEARDLNAERIGEVRDLIVNADGQIDRVVIGVSGVLRIGERYLGVPWNEVTIGRDMQFVEVPVRADNLPEFSLFTGVKDDVPYARGQWRVNRLLGDFARLEDLARFGLVIDMIFDRRGMARAVIVDGGAGWWADAGWYAFPYAGYDPRAPFYALPYRAEDLGLVAEPPQAASPNR